MTAPFRALVAVAALAAAAGCASVDGGARRPSDTGAPTTPRITVQAAPEAAPAPAPGLPETPPTPGPPRSFSVGPPAPAPEPAAPAPPAPTAPAPAPSAPPPPAGPRRLVVFNFDNADLEVVVQAASEIVGFNYVIAPTARGRKVTVQTTGRIPSNEVFAVLLTILDVNGLTAIKSGSLYRIIPREGAAQTPVRTVVGRDVDARVAGDEILTQIVPLQYINASNAVNLLRPFVPPQGGLTAHQETNLLILTDTADNVRRVLDILRLADVPVAVEELQIIPLKHADAQEVAQLLAQIFAGGQLRPAALPAAVPAAVPVAPPTPTAPGVRPVPRAAQAESAPGERPPLIVAERRSNSLIVNAGKQEIQTIRRLIEQLDVDIYGGQRVFIYFAENAKAKELAAILDAIFGRGAGPAVTGATGAPATPGYGAPGSRTLAPGLPASAAARPGQTGPRTGGEEGGAFGAELRFIADETTNAVIVSTYPRVWRDVEDTIKRLDRMPRQVLIEVLAVEVSLTDDLRLGVDWAIRTGRFFFSSSSQGALPGRPPVQIIPLGGQVAAGLFAFTSASDLLSAINALATDNRVNVLSSPSIMTTENKKAVINVSTSVPIVTGQQVPVATGGTTGNSITQSVEYRDAGIILTVTPRIGEQGTVALDVKQEVNEVGENEPPPINSPRFTKREAETSVVLLNHQTLALGGLIQTRRSVQRSGIPFLHKIPILGYLFGFASERTQKTELILFITPRVVGTAVEAARVTDELKRSSPELERSIRGAPRPPLPSPAPPAPPAPTPGR